MAKAESFPAGLRVLVVDDDTTCLRIVEQMLRRCSYEATTCSQATVALNLLRDRKGCFDLVLSDVHMPDMDGFKLLELVGLEMDIPVIMMSADGRTCAVMRGIRHGACDYLIKPIREKELKNIWQHVVRKKWKETKDHEVSSSLDDNDRHKRGSDDAEYISSVNEGSEGMLKSQKKRKDTKDEDDGELENDDPTASKKPRVVWSVELHQQFVNAVNQLGIDKAVPKRILELMNVPGLTRENVASHLQKFRLYLKRLSGVAQQVGIPSSFGGPLEQNLRTGQLGRFDFQTLAASGQIPPQTLAALHADLLGRPTGNLVLPAMDEPTLLKVAQHGQKCISSDPGVTYGQPLMKCPSNVSKQFSQPIFTAGDLHSSFGTWTSNSLGTVAPIGNHTGVAAQNDGNILMSIQQQQKQSAIQEPTRSINVQPSCLVFPSQSTNFQAGNSPASVNQSCTYNRSSVIDYSLIAQPNNSSSGVEQMLDRDFKLKSVLNGYSVPGPVSPFLLSFSNVDTGDSQRVQNSDSTVSVVSLSPTLMPNMNGFQGSFAAKSSQVHDNGPLRNLEFVGKGTSIPSRFAVDEEDLPVSNFSRRSYLENNGRKVKQEPNLDIIENANMGNPTMQHFSPNDFTSLFA